MSGGIVRNAMLAPLKYLMLKSALWFKERAHGRHTKAWLFIFSFSEAIFLFIPVDPLLIAILLVGAKRWIYYAVFTTVASVAGGVVGYAIGFFFFDTVGVRIIEFYGLAEDMAKAAKLFDKNTFLVIFLGAFTPLPYKIFVLSGGFFKISFFAFLSASIVGRGLRYFLVAGITAAWGASAVRLFFRYFNIATIVSIVLFLVVLLWYT